jgi:predicted nucleic acid-binding protein
VTVKRGPDVLETSAPEVPETAAPAETGSRPWLLDTSALLSFIEDEAGADRVEEVLRLPTTIVPWPVLLETHYISLRDEGQAEADRRIALIKQLNVRIPWDMDEATLLTASRLKADYRVSLADAMIAAFAIRAGAVLIHKDPEFDALSAILPMEALPYKA